MKHLALIASMLAGVSIAHAQTDATELHYRGTLLYGKWSTVGTIQAAIDEALKKCGQPGIAADGLYGEGTRQGLRRLAACPDFQSLGLGQGQANDGVVTERVWSSLLPGHPLPSVQERALTAWLVHEATDYDRAEFNFVGAGNPQPNDKTSYLTWGPYGATVGHGREVQAILADPKAAGSIAGCFQGETAAFTAMLGTADAAAGEAVRQAYMDLGRRASWKKAFACLGGVADVRAAYDAYAFKSNQWLKPALRRLYRLVSGPNVTATDTDFAFFVDVAMHMGVSDALLAKASAAADQRARTLNRALTPAERRQVIGQVFVDGLSNQVEDRRGRNVVYYVDGVGDAALSEVERKAWRDRSGMRASDFGLRDTAFQPDLR